MATSETEAHLGGRRRTVLVVAMLVVMAGYSYVASGTTPFTAGADTVTAVPFAVAAALGVRALLRRREHPQAISRPAGGRMLPWVISLGALVVWEVVTYAAGFSGGRHAFPTISSLADEAFRHRGAKAAAFAGWLGLGWGVVRR